METAITSLNNIRDYIITFSYIQILCYANQFFFAPRAIPFKSMGEEIDQSGWGLENPPQKVGMGVKY